MVKTVKVKLENLVYAVEDFWVKRSLLVCLALAFLSGFAHYFGLVVNIRSLTSNIVTFASIVIGVTGVFLTLLITLQESPVFERIRFLFPNIQAQLYVNLKNQIYFGLILVIMSIIIYMMPQAPFRFLASIGVSVWSFFFWSMSLGSFYSVKLITDLMIKNVEIPIRTPRK